MTISLLERYDTGANLEVWAELHAMGSLADKPKVVREEASRVCTRTMERALRNVIVIHKRLLETGYPFEYPDEVVVPPNNETTELSHALKISVGEVPLALQAWLRIVGNVCLRRRSRSGTDSELLLDPLEFAYSLEQLDEAKSLDRERSDEGDSDSHFPLQFAGDLYHKNDISGGGPSYIILPSDSVDAIVVEDDCARIVERMRIEGKPLSSEHAIAIQGKSERRVWFVDYLREYFAGAGFRRISRDEDVARHSPIDPLIQLLEI